MFRLNYYHGTKSVTMFTYDAIKAQWVVIKSGISSGVEIIERPNRIIIKQIEKNCKPLPFDKQRIVQTFPTAATVVFYDFPTPPPVKKKTRTKK